MKKLPPQVKKKLAKTLRIFKEDPFYPSLRSEKVRGTTNVFRARIDLKYRFSFHYAERDICVLRNVGIHKKINHNP